MKRARRPGINRLHPSAFVLALMRLRLIWVGKTRDAHLRALAGEYLKRLSRFARCEVTELRESAAAEERACLEEEGKYWVLWHLML